MFDYKNYVYEVYKERSITKAAANLYISQPSLSARIIKIEEELGMPIFDRSTTPLRLTEFGKVYIKAVEEVSAIEKRVESYVSDINMLRTGELTFGASNVFAAYALPPIIAEFKERFPDVKIRLIEGNTETLEELLSTNEIDMVIDNNRYDEALYEKTLYSEERILLAVPKIFSECDAARKFALSEESIKNKYYLNDDCVSVPLEIFAKTPFVMLTANNDTRTRGDKLCREAGFRPGVVLEVHQQATAYMVAATMMGATFVSDAVVEKLPTHENLAYYKLGGDAARRLVYFYFKRNKYKSRAMTEFMKLITMEN